MSAIHGVSINPDQIDRHAVDTLRDDHVVRFRAVPKTVMTSPLAEDDNWLIVDTAYPAQMQTRYETLLDKRDWVIDRMPGDDVRAAEYELRDTVVTYMTTTYPDYFIKNGSDVHCRLTGITVDCGPYGADPLVAAALLATEDLLLMVPSAQDDKGNTIYPLKSGVLAFPNGWSLSSRFNQPEPAPAYRTLHQAWLEAQQESVEAARLGRTTYQIHNGHVRHFMENFASRVDTFFTKMPAEKVYWRRNWAPSLSTKLFRHADGEFPPLPTFTPELWDEQGFVRSEHETFTKLPVSKAVIFGIKTYIWPLRDIVANPVALGALQTAYDNMEQTPSMYEYRAASLPTFGELLRRYPRQEPG